MGRDALDEAWRPNPPRRRDDKPAQVQASKPSVFTKIKAGVKLARSIRKAHKESPMKNWKTTLGGILIALGQFAPQFVPADWHWVGATLTGIGGVILGKTALDAAAVKDTAKK